jgi:hypothetical protein
MRRFLSVFLEGMLIPDEYTAIISLTQDNYHSCFSIMHGRGSTSFLFTLSIEQFDSKYIKHKKKQETRVLFRAFLASLPYRLPIPKNYQSTMPDFKREMLLTKAINFSARAG